LLRPRLHPDFLRRLPGAPEHAPVAPPAPGAGPGPRPGRMRANDMKKLLLPLVSSLALAACTVGPNYARPETPTVAGGAFIGAGNPAFTPAEPEAGWWRLYQDPVLDQLVEEALAHNIDLRVATANLARARALLRETRAGRLPQVG